MATTPWADEADAPRLTISVDLVTGRITMRGELDRGSAHHLVDAVEALARTPLDHWELDAAAVSFCDAGGLRALASCSATARQRGRSMHLARASRCVARLVELVGLDELLADPARPVGTAIPLTRSRWSGTAPARPGPVRLAG